MKKIVFIIALLFMSLMAMGFMQTRSLPSNSFSLQTEVLASGGVSQTIVFPTLIEDLKIEHNDGKINAYLEKLEQSIETNVYNNMYMKYWLKYLEDPKTEYIIGGEVVQFSRPTLNDSKNKIYFSMNFLNSDAWNYYNPKEEKQQDDDSNFFFLDKIESKSVFPFAEEVAAAYINILTECIDSSFEGFNMNDIDIYFEYDYVTPYSKIRSNADIKQSTSQGYLHSWIQKRENLSDQKTINIWYNKPNCGLWYLFVLGVTLSGLVISLLILKLKRKIKNNANCS